jgi:hypothetical protein
LKEKAEWSFRTFTRINLVALKRVTSSKEDNWKTGSCTSLMQYDARMEFIQAGKASASRSTPFVHGCLKDYMFYTEGTPSEEVIEELEDLGFPIRETLAYLEEVEGTYNSEGEALLPIGGASVSEAPPQLAVSVNDSQVAEMCFTLECPLADVEPCNLEL